MTANDFLYGLCIGFGMGGIAGLWLGFKLWRQTYSQTTITNLPGRGWMK